MDVHGSLQVKFDSFFYHNTKFLLSVITCNELWIICYDLELKHNSSVVIKWLTSSEERTHSTFGTVMLIVLKTAVQNTVWGKRDLSSLQNSGLCFKTVHSYLLHKRFWALLMLKHELCGQKLGLNREEMQVAAAVLLKVSEDDLLHVFGKWVECLQNV